MVDLASSNIGYPGKWQGVPINCYSCEGWECQTLSLGVIGKCENNNKQNCATVFAANGTVIQRGCSDVIYNSERLSYCDKNPSLCKFCKSSGCNTAISINDYVDCIFCDGSVDSDCIFYPETKTHTRSCHKNCMTALYPRTNEDNPAYELSRSCLDDLDLDDREQCQSGIRANCKSCSEDKCNNVIVPETRLKCNVCHGNECEEYISAQCTSYRENDKCFTLFDEESNIQGMGCASDLDNSFISSNRRNLLLCEGDNCNDVLNLPQPPSCRWCSSDNDPDCASSPSTTTATVCHLYPNTECYMAVDEGNINKLWISLIIICLTSLSQTVLHVEDVSQMWMKNYLTIAPVASAQNVKFAVQMIVTAQSSPKSAEVVFSVTPHFFLLARTTPSNSLKHVCYTGRMTAVLLN